MKVSNSCKINYYNLFAKTIDQAKNFAIGPFYGYITNHIDKRIEWVSENINQLTPHTKREWLNHDPEFCLAQFLPEDKPYVLEALRFIGENYPSMSEAERKAVKVNVYARALNAKKKYTWIMIQVPDTYINEKNQVESSLYIVYDLPHFRIANQPFFSVIDHNNHEIQYHKQEEHRMMDTKPLMVSTREREILKLMAEGFNSPEISQKLFISYHTVENHKRNLRKKTNTRTSSALMVFAITHNLIFV
ncbi:helix-turn-helix transcriptional regulator [Pedobacter sp. KR3-3]|uniref:Helix-turn-helix transcriptional regulator n=1 Tax=Pedobacter albus TaxID=3113905 RepID=A0ABU7I2U5_9SPHI|nr:helix-turn-helix transcriptional regulator [Pedobacter sp. KR3-3]MEE1943773.1 helix-turn-helix transcriptional regulator [Pedobacter sp. KR3-3]